MRVETEFLAVLVARCVRVGERGGGEERLQGGGGVGVYPEGPEGVVQVEDYQGREGEGGG